MKKQTRAMFGKMLGMLGSDQDGEILAAARAIRRLLESEGLTFADLVQLIGAPAGGAVVQYDGLAGMAGAILQNAEKMKQHEIRFVQSIMTQATLHPYFRMSEKQAKWFGFLFDRYGA